LLYNSPERQKTGKSTFNVTVTGENMKSVGKNMLMCALLQVEQGQEKWQG